MFASEMLNIADVMYTDISIEDPLGRATPPPFYFWSVRQFQGGEVKHAIQSRPLRQDDIMEAI